MAPETTKQKRQRCCIATTIMDPTRGGFSFNLHGRRREVEVRMKDALLKEYRDVMARLAPEVQGMGRFVGSNMVDVLVHPRLFGHRKYPQRKGAQGGTERSSVGEYSVATMEIVSPMLDPFLDGMWEPIREAIGKLKFEIGGLCAVSGLLGLGLGILISRRKSKDG